MHMTIDGVPIGRDYPPFIIAEVSANHNGSLDRARDILAAIKGCGAQAAKIQTFTADSLTIDCNSPEFLIDDGIWKGRTLFDLYREAAMPLEWNKLLFEEARRLSLTIFSSPFDHAAVDLLEDLNAPAYKIASFEAVDLPLIRYAASTGKPLIISTGMASAEEIGEAIASAREGGCEQLAILHCVSGYPAPASDYHLRTLPDMSEKFGVVTGLSDHTLDNSTAIASVALGASIIEKHVTLDRNGGGPDDSFSLEPPELSRLCRDALTAWQALGSINYQKKSSEVGNVQFRRSLYFVKDLKQGELITPDAIRSIRPGFGISPKHQDQVVGSYVTTDIARGTAVQFSHFQASE